MTPIFFSTLQLYYKISITDSLKDKRLKPQHKWPYKKKRGCIKM